MMASDIRFPLFGFFVFLAVVVVVILIDVQMVSTTDVVVVKIELAHGGQLLGVLQRVDPVGVLGIGMYSVFLGVRYAEPPIGTRRFASPVKKTPWSGPMTVASSGPLCPSSVQPSPTPPNLPNFAGPEDCLTLDIYVPYNAASNVTTRDVPPTSESNATATPMSLPTIVYMVGDNREAETFAYGSELFVYSDVIVVLVKHRLDVLGYLSTGSSDCPGNLGLMDQGLALEWVQENIALFGGDPTRVTLAGGRHSYVSLHLYMSPVTIGEDRRLFQRLIATDGAATTPRFLPKEPPVPATQSVATQLGCLNNSALVDCLRNKTVGELLSAAAKMRSEFALSPWKPYFDGQLISSNTTGSFQNGSVRNLDVMLGFSTQNGTVLLPSYFITLPSDNNLEAAATDNFVQELSGPSLANVAPRLVNTSLLITLIRQQYVDWTIPDLQGGGVSTSLSSNYVVEIAADLSVTVPFFYLIDDIKSQLFASNIFLFSFDMTANANATSIWTYMFGLPIRRLSQVEFNDEQRQLAMNLVKYSSKFARDGNPNANNSSDVLGVSPLWPPYNQSGQILVLRTTNTSEDVGTTCQNNMAKSVAFWTVTVPEVGEFLENVTEGFQNTNDFSLNGSIPTGSNCDNPTAKSDSNSSCSDSHNVTTPGMIQTSNNTQASATPEMSNVVSTTQGTPEPATSNDPCPMSCQSANPTSEPNSKLPTDVDVVVGPRTIRWALTLRQANIVIQVMLGLAIFFASLAIILWIVLCRTCSELRRSRMETPLPNRQGRPKSIRGSGSRWIWRPRDPDDTLDDNTDPYFESKGITLDTEESPSLERLDILKTDIF